MPLDDFSKIVEKTYREYNISTDNLGYERFSMRYYLQVGLYALVREYCAANSISFTLNGKDIKRSDIYDFVNLLQNHGYNLGSDLNTVSKILEITPAELVRIKREYMGDRDDMIEALNDVIAAVFSKKTPEAEKVKRAKQEVEDYYAFLSLKPDI